MLRRPELLLNPWAMQPSGGIAGGVPGGVAGGMGGGIGSGSGGRIGEPPAEALPPDVIGNLDFLGESSVVLTNLRPDGGVLRIDRKVLGNRQHIHILAVDPENTVYRSISLPEQPPDYRDLRFADGLDPVKHFAEREKISIVEKNAAFTLSDSDSSAMELYDSVESVYKLFTNLSNNKTLNSDLFWIGRK